MSDYKLSICIPTFNRAEYINELLKSIVCQDLQGVEVVVSDNASTDNTCDVLALYAKKYANIKYSLSETNLGADLNYFRAVEMASGEYCWIIGSDDCLDAGAIKFVLNVLDF